VKKSLFSLIVVICLVAVYGFIATSTPGDNPGKKVFVDAKCNNCHNVASDSIVAVKAMKNVPDLSSVGSSVAPDSAKKYLLKQAKINDKLHMVKFNGTEEDLNALAGWLGTLKAPVAKECPAIKDTNAVKEAPKKEEGKKE